MVCGCVGEWVCLDGSVFVCVCSTATTTTTTTITVACCNKKILFFCFILIKRKTTMIRASLQFWCYGIFRNFHERNQITIELHVEICHV